MTIDEQVDEIDSSLKDTQQSFQVVLVDIEKAAKDKIIHCVKKPLEEQDLKYVALSYRWGELHETLIDTGVGYTASITSFALDDFHRLCYMMTIESDTKDIPYVWVDAICVDQQNRARRKETIYQMSNIYDKATYILAVPDLHVTYLKGVSIKNDDIIKDLKTHAIYVYHLIHGNTDELAALDDHFLDYYHVPKDPPAFRQLLLEYTDYFGSSFMKFKAHYSPAYCPVRGLDHIFEALTKAPQRHPRHYQPWIKDHHHNKKQTIEALHECHEPVCPLTLFDREYPLSTASVNGFEKSNWKLWIMNRGNSIRQSMECLTDLVRDWSSRVWVISEYNIAKKKNNLKYWFIQLNPEYASYSANERWKKDLTFFKFDFDGSFFSDGMIRHPYYADREATDYTRYQSTNPIYIRFHYTMVRQLKQQTFLDMMLSSKASRNEDRFYSILPLSDYHGKKAEVSHWHIQSMVSVKLKLFEMMNTKDKLVLLCWSTHKRTIANGILPTFATTTLFPEFETKHLFHVLSNGYCNFDLNDEASTVMLHYHSEDDDDKDSNRYYLRLKPKEYYVVKNYAGLESRTKLLDRCAPLCERLGIKHASDIVVIPACQWTALDRLLESQYDYSKYADSEDDSSDVDSSEDGASQDDYKPYYLFLVGSFAQHKWVIPSKHGHGYTSIRPDKDSQSGAYFDIY
ncbi:unnamed protein product [Absidia cylindrospora]